MQPACFVETIKERCRVCYTCVRECPSKAIRIQDGQANIIAQRCIGCGNCVRVCSQAAKQVVPTQEQVAALLTAGRPLAMIVAPSFPAEFPELEPDQFVGLCRALGFTWVCEVGFGADLVARRYRELLERRDGKRYIATSCPAVVAYVEKYLPDLVDELAPIVSPMVASARVVRARHGGADLGVVFVGPCIAKKCEGLHPLVGGDVDAVLTFTELRQLFAARGLTPATCPPTAFDPPHAGLGAIFPVSRGLLQTARITEDLLTDDVVATDGRSTFVEALREFYTGALNVRLLEILACNGCIMGAGMSSEAPLFSRRARVSRHVARRLAEFDEPAWRADLERFRDLDLGRRFAANDQRLAAPSEEELRQILERMGKTKPEHLLNCGACGYDSCREHALAIHRGLAEREMCLPYTIDQLRGTIKELAHTNVKLGTAQEALLHSQTMASMGQLAAGIAHEVNNPLGVVLMYAHLLLEDCDPKSRLHDDVRLIVQEADRCKKIVAGLLHFARQNKVLRQETDVCDLVQRAVAAGAVPPNIVVTVNHTAGRPLLAEVDGDQLIQVLTNLISNACAAMPDGGDLTIETAVPKPDRLEFRVRDTGFGIPPANRHKIFEPFFTTKQIGKGTGLGLSVSYGIVKMHCGDLRFESNHDRNAGPTGTTFFVNLPRFEPAAAEAG